MRLYLFGMPPFDHDIALVQLQPDGTVDRLLTRGEAAGHELPLGAEEVAVVQDVAKLRRDELVPQRPDVPIEREALDVHVRHAEDRRSRGFVATPTLHADEPILNDVDSPNAMSARGCVERKENVDAVGVRRRCASAFGEDDFDGEAGLEVDGEAFGLFGCVFG